MFAHVYEENKYFYSEIFSEVYDLLPKVSDIEVTMPFVWPEHCLGVGQCARRHVTTWEF